jgi:hypothetical protein
MPGTPRIDLGEGFVRQQELIEQLRKDIADAYSALEKDRSSQYLRRCVVRSVFSFIEALLECVKWELRSSVRMKEFESELSEKEKETLGSLHVTGSRNDKFLSLDQNVKRTFRLAAKVWELKDFRLNTGGEDFQDFLRAKAARNRLTHPKTVCDIEVTDYDMSCHTIAGMWIQSEVRRLMRTRIATLIAQIPEEERDLFEKELLPIGIR